MTSFAVETAQIQADELLLLLPALSKALRKDNRGVVSTGGARFSSSLPLNRDVLDCIVTVTTEMRMAEIMVRKELGYSQHTAERELEEIAASWPGYIEALDGKKLDPEAALGSLASWLRRARKAIGLSMPAAPLGSHLCPYNCGVLLLVLGAEGALMQRGDGYGVEWSHAAKIICPVCQVGWQHSEWPLLGRLLGVDEPQGATAATIARTIGVPSSSIRRWASEGRIISIGINSRGWPLYNIDNVRHLAESHQRIAA